jgi:hypothetical protein
LHARSASRIAGEGSEVDGGPRREAWLLEARQPAVVLGSAEPADHIDAQTARDTGFEVARRRSGGAGVVVGPGRCLWIDVVIGRGDSLWDDDIGRAAWWVGQLWVDALSAIGVVDAEVWHGPLQRSEWSQRACFAGLGPGEVTVGGGKTVGVSQRRTKVGALFQCAVLLGPDGPSPDGPNADGPNADGPNPDGLAELADLQALGPTDRKAMLGALRRSTTPLSQRHAPLLSAAVRSLLGAS